MRSFTAELPDTIHVLRTKTFHDPGPCPVQRSHGLKTRQGSLVGFQPRQSFLFFGNAIVDNSQPSNHRRKGEPLYDERSENHTEREQQEKVASGGWFAIGKSKRNRQRACE